MRRFISSHSLLLAGFALTAACGGKAENERRGGDGDGDGEGDGDKYNEGSGSAAGDGDGLNATGGNASGGAVEGTGGGEGADTVCAPFAVRLCDGFDGDEICAGLQVCDEDGTGWGSCECASGAGGAGGAGPSDGVCSDVRACGGNVPGQWVVRSSCLSVGDRMVVRDIGLGCNEVDVAGALLVRGRLTLSEDRSVTDDTVTVGSLALGIHPECLDVSGTVVTCEGLSVPLKNLGFSEVTCLDAFDGGCACVAQVNQAGGLGYVPSAASTPGGDYIVNGEELAVFSANVPRYYSYCALENALTVTPTGNELLRGTSGTIVFERVD